MSAAMAVPLPDQVAIINDDPSDRDIWSLQIEEAGFRPVVIEQPAGRAFASVAELLAQIEGHARWAVCDHRLSRGGLAQFYGAEAVAQLNQRRQTPALLVTTWSKIDVDVSIRRYRSNVPILLSADEFQDPVIIRAQLKACSEEVIDGRIPAHRVARKSLVHVETRTTESGIEVVDAVIPGWNPNTKVRFPLALVEPALWEQVRDGAYFLAYVNRGAEKEEDLFLERFEIAPEVDPNDGLA
jgi:CheY-like chemotaxis protein